MTHRDLPRVEPLSDLAWARIERGVFDALDQGQPAPLESASSGRRWRRAALVGGGCVTAVAAILLFVSSDWLSSEGPVRSAGTARVVTESSASHFSVGDADLTVDPNSAILVDHDESGAVRIILERGRVACKVAPREDRPPVSLLAGEVRIEVVGTAFSVTRIADSAQVVVHEGVVRVTADGEATKVGPGETWPAQKTAAAEPTADAEPEAELRSKRERAARAKERARAKRARAKAAAKAESESGAEGESERSAKERFARASQLEASDPDAALALYRELVREGGAWSSPALFARARLAFEAGRTEMARRLLRRYLQRHPHGTNAADARELLQNLEQP